MQGYNCIMVYSKDGEKLLLCRRTKDPYMGKYNLVGGKIEDEREIMPLTESLKRKQAYQVTT